MIPEWSKQYTTHVPFLKDTQSVIRDMEYVLPPPLSTTEETTPYTVNCDHIMDIWKSLKEDDFFLDKYGYMDWELLLYLNQSSSFLQTLTLVNLVSPIYNLAVPIIIMIVPFVLLKLQGIHISVQSYFEVLKTIARNNTIGKLIFSDERPKISSVVYGLISVGLYMFQIYQSFSSSFKFYRNICRIDNHLNELKQFLRHSATRMENFVYHNKSKSTYEAFCHDVAKHTAMVHQMAADLEGINEKRVLSKMSDFGYLLKCYYVLYSKPEYETTLRYCVGFEGYIENLRGLWENLTRRKISSAQFSETKCCVRNQYYPPFVDAPHVKNSCNLKTNVIITGVNASGKTTVLKTTLLNIIFSQQMGCGCYESFILHPYTHLHSYLNIPDTSGRDSLFQAETRRCKEIIDVIHGERENEKKKTFRHFCIFDELYSGTNPQEATKCAYSFLLYLAKFENVNFMLTTHYTSICKRIRTKSSACKTKIRNYKMVVEKNAEGMIRYTYKMKPGVCRIEGAVNVLKSMNYPREIIHDIETFHAFSL